MRIIVDADANPTNDICLEVAKEYNLHIIFVFDSTHHFNFNYGQMIVVDKGSDSVDFKVISLLEKGDILVTQDYELASFALNKHAYCLNQFGLIINSSNIETLCLNRYLNQKARKAGIRSKSFKKRQESDNIEFKKSLLKIIKEEGNKNG